jgi:ABC-type transport system involved in cytochrome bd biosynthesis fused ATPase/permease subunit
MSTRQRFGISVLLVFILFYLCSLHPPVGALLALALLTVVIVGQRIDVRRSERQERARLADDAQRQHAAWVAGNDQYAVHGRYAPVIESKWGYPE